MKLTVTIACDNAAFHDDFEGEIAAVLDRAARSIAEGGTGRIRDTNGNTVGSWQLTDD